MKYVIAYDLGTSSIKASVVDSNTNVIESAVKETHTFSDSNGIREQRPEEWKSALIEVTNKLLEKFPYPDKIECISISGHSLGVVAIDDKNNLLIDKTPIWSDERAKKEADSFFEKVDYEKWYEQTGNGFTRQLYSVFKIMWYKNNNPEVYSNTKTFLGTKDYLNMILTGRVCTDHSYASGSGVYILKQRKYNVDYIKIAGLKETDFPEIVESSEVIGTLTKEISKILGLPETVKVVGGGVDNACMSLGAGCIGDGDVYVSLGTSSWIAVASQTADVDFKKKIYTWAHCVPNTYLPSSGIFSACSSLEWVINNLFKELPKEERYNIFNKMAEECDYKTNEVYFCPVMSGGSYVDVSPDMKGGFMNIDLATTKDQIARATLEGIALELNLSLKALSSITTLANQILFVGGGAESSIWLDIFANVFNKEITKGQNSRNAATIGAAALAFVGLNIWEDYSMLKKPNENVKTHIPNCEDVEFYCKKMEKFIKVCEAHAQIYQYCRRG